MTEILENIIAGIIIALCAIYLIRRIWLNLRGIDKGQVCRPEDCSSCSYNTGECTSDNIDKKTTK